jgi:hypothetical protein
MCLWYGNDKNTDGHVRNDYTGVLCSCLWIVDILHPVTLVFADRLQLHRVPKKFCNTVFLLLVIYCIII